MNYCVVLCACVLLLTGLSLLIDGKNFNYTSLTNESVTLNGSVAIARPENDSFVMAFPSGISVTVKVVSGALSIVFAAPRSFKNQTKGLLGTWNDDPEDDFLTPNGTILPSNANGKDIHHDFGLLCKLISLLLIVATVVSNVSEPLNNVCFSYHSYVLVTFSSMPVLATITFGTYSKCFNRRAGWGVPLEDKLSQWYRYERNSYQYP